VAVEGLTKCLYPHLVNPSPELRAAVSRLRKHVASWDGFKGPPEVVRLKDRLPGILSEARQTPGALPSADEGTRPRPAADGSLPVHVPAQVIMPGGQQQAVEWADAVHVATAFSRGPASLLRTQDRQ
jgi:hypothetical protein